MSADKETVAARVAEALRTSRLSWGVHADRWGDQEWQQAFWAEAAEIALAAAVETSAAGAEESGEPGIVTGTETGDDGGTTTIAATGNGMKSHDLHDTFLEVSGGGGNHDDKPEVHLRIRSNDGHNEGQSWFPASEVIAAIQSAVQPVEQSPLVFTPDVLRRALSVPQDAPHVFPEGPSADLD